jgi:hypothetical protein
VADARAREVAKVIWDVVQEAWRRLRGQRIIDRRAHAAQVHSGYATRARDLSHVTGICVHQTAADMGEDPARYDTMGAHVGVTRGGRIIQLHDPERWVCAANGWNAGTVSIEISGRYCGIEGDERTYWRNPKNPLPPQKLTPEATEAGRAAIRWIVADVEKRGGKIRVIVTHRQSSAQRLSDPGQEICQQIIVPIAAELGIEFASDAVLGDGKPCPEQWDERRKGVRY